MTSTTPFHQATTHCAAFGRVVNLIRRTAGGVLAAVSIVGFGMDSNAQRWQDVPGLGLGGVPDLYFSTDMTPLELTIGVWEGGGAPTVWANLSIPRAFVVHAQDYDPRATPLLPSRIGMGVVTLVMTYPEWRPLSVQAQALAAARGIGFVEAATILLPHSHVITISASRGTPPQVRVDDRSVVDTLDGLVRREGPSRGTIIYEGDREVDEFSSITCGPADRSAGQVNCSAAFRVSPTLHAFATMGDFRLPGGRAFINERIRALRSAVLGHVVSAAAPFTPPSTPPLRSRALQ